MALYKKKCVQCNKNWALVHSGRQRFAVCEECEMKAVAKPIEDPDMKKLFTIPIQYYRENPFLRSVRYQYGRFGGITDKQEEAFKKTVDDLKKGIKKEPIKKAKSKTKKQ